mgnify:CR=1 FL=1
MKRERERERERERKRAKKKEKKIRSSACDTHGGHRMRVCCGVRVV